MYSLKKKKKKKPNLSPYPTNHPPISRKIEQKALRSFCRVRRVVVFSFFFYRENSRGISSDGVSWVSLSRDWRANSRSCLGFRVGATAWRVRNGERERTRCLSSSILLLSRPLSLSRTLVSIRLAAGCSIFDANAKPSEKVNANAKLDTRRARRRRNFEEQQILLDGWRTGVREGRIAKENWKRIFHIEEKNEKLSSSNWNIDIAVRYRRQFFIKNLNSCFLNW